MVVVKCNVCLFAFIWIAVLNFFATRSIQKQGKFSLEDSQEIDASSVTISTATSIVECAARCLMRPVCCQASFTVSDKQCLMDLTDGFKAVIKQNNGSTLLTKGCLRGWQILDRRCIYVGEDETPENAKRTCAENGGWLVIIDSAEKNAWLHGVAKRLNIWPQLAGVRVGEKGFYWKDKNGYLKPFSFVNWHRGEPNGAVGIQDCVMMRKDSGGWNDFDCKDKLNFICEQI